MRTRRGFLKAGSIAALGTLAASAARGREPVALVIYDSRSWKSRAFARRFNGELVDVADEHRNLWSRLRAAPPSGRIVGLTRWSDHVIARGYLEEQRKRLSSDARHGELIYWEMA
jgi:hypothetical protein